MALRSMRLRGRFPLPGHTLATGFLLLALSTPAAGQSADPFAVLQSHGNASGALVPPRAIAVLPERHTGRLLRMVDVLVAIDPQFDDFAANAGLTGTAAIQLRTREARVPIFVAKNDATIATLLQVPIGSRVEIRGVLVPRGNRYLFIAASVRPATERRAR
ncbi:MAG: hypothetical protein AAGF12_37425 [Myxococcota bacterium]